MTPLQEIYDAFFIKTDEDFTGKEDQVFQYLKAALGYSYKTTPHSLGYTLSATPNIYDGYMNETLDQDEIELISLFMKKEYIRKKMSPLEKLKIRLGTKDFNKLPDKLEEYKLLQLNMKTIEEEIFAFRQEFYPYSG